MIFDCDLGDDATNLFAGHLSIQVMPDLLDEGNVDVYVVPAEGGGARRLTWHPEADNARGWSPDGRRLYYLSDRDGFTQTVSFTGADVTVLRAQRRTTAAGGFSLGDVFLRNPPFTHTEIPRGLWADCSGVIPNQLAHRVWQFL